MEFRWGGKARPGETGEEPDEVVIHLRGSKTDQYRAGASRNHYRAEDPGFCVVNMLWKLKCRLGARAKGALFRLPHDGKVLQRGTVGMLLRAAAKDLGLPYAQVASHSLRVGGATALYHAGFSEKEILYWGRWRGTSWMLYTHRTHGGSRGVASAMLRARYQLLAPRTRAATGGH